MYIRTPDDLIEVLTAQNANVSLYQAEVGATGQDIADIGNTLLNAVAIKTFVESVFTDKETSVQLKDTYFKGPVNSTMGAVPVFQVFAWPKTPVAGQIPIANTRNRRFLNSPTITEEAIVALMLRTEPAPPPPAPKPTGEAHAAQSGYAAAVIVGNRAGSDRWKLMGRASSTEPWTMIDSFTDKSGNFVYAGTNDAPIKLELQIQLMKKDQPYGPASDTFYVTLNP